jgi:hypothetical protein
MTETKKAKETSGTELTRFNAFRHGLLSRFTVLPWESSEEYETVLEALAVEYAPQGPTEEHLVEELAHIFWRKRRLRLAESATHRRAFGKVLSPLNHISEDAVITIPRISKGEWVEEAVSATDEQSAEELAELKQEGTDQEAQHPFSRWMERNVQEYEPPPESKIDLLCASIYLQLIERRNELMALLWKAIELNEPLRISA